jgi:hypothetical protein
MKKIMLVFAALFVMSAVLMVSCDKDESDTSLNIDLLKKATIKGYVYAQLDLTTAGLEKAIPGTKIIISVPYSDLNSSASGNYKDTTVVSADGTFEIEVPVGNSSAYISIIPLPFETTQVQELGSIVSPVKKYYTAGTSYLTLSASDYEIVEITYNDHTFADFVEMAQISGLLRAETNDTIFGLEATTAGISLIFQGEGWNKTVTTTDSGSYTITLPANQNVYVSYSFTAQHVVWNFDEFKYLPVPYIYKNKLQYVSSFFATTYEDITINAIGEPVE